MTRRGWFQTSDLVPLLAERGVILSREQVYRLVTQSPQRLSLDTLVALCDILQCTPNDLIEPVAAPRQVRRVAGQRAAAPVSGAVYAAAAPVARGLNTRCRFRAAATYTPIPRRRPDGGRPVCGPCAGSELDYRGHVCGTVTDLASAARCARCARYAHCALTEKVSERLAGPGRHHPGGAAPVRQPANRRTPTTVGPALGLPVSGHGPARAGRDG